MQKLAVIFAVTAVVLASGQALADDAAAPAARAAGDIVYRIGGRGPASAVDEVGGASLWTDLRHALSEATLTFGAAPVGDDGSNGKDAAYNAYADIALKGFKFGGRFTQEGDPAHGENAGKSYGVGASYSLESLTVGIDWSHGNYDEVFLDVGSGEDSDVIAFTSSYALRPGVRVNGLVEYSEQQPAEEGANAGAFTVGIGTLISF